MSDISQRFLVVIRLNQRSDLEITTTATHALSIMSGETIFPPEDTEVFDADGNPVGRRRLTHIAQQRGTEQNG